MGVSPQQFKQEEVEESSPERTPSAESSVQQLSPPRTKQAAPAKTSAKRSQNESPQKREVTAIQTQGKQSPLHPSRRAAEQAKQALMTSKKSKATKDKVEKSAGNKKPEVAPITTRSRTPIKTDVDNTSPKRQAAAIAKTSVKAAQQQAKATPSTQAKSSQKEIQSTASIVTKSTPTRSQIDSSSTGKKTPKKETPSMKTMAEAAAASKQSDYVLRSGYSPAKKEAVAPVELRRSTRQSKPSHSLAENAIEKHNQHIQNLQAKAAEIKHSRQTRSKAVKNPLSTQKFEAQTEIVKNNGKDIENANEKMNFSDDEDDKQMKNQLQKEQEQIKEKKKPEPEFYT